MIRRFTSSPNPASRVAAMTCSALGSGTPSGPTRRPYRMRVELGQVAARLARAGSGSTPRARARSAGRRPRRPRRRRRRAAAPTPRTGPGRPAANRHRDSSRTTPIRSPVTSARRAASTTGGTGASMLVESIGSWPAMTSCSSAASSTVRVHRAGLVEAGGQRDQAVAGDPAVGRLDPDRAGDRGRLPDRAAGVGADGERRLVRRDRRRRAAARAAGDPGQVPGVVRRTVRRVLGRGAHRELVHVGLARG